MSKGTSLQSEREINWELTTYRFALKGCYKKFFREKENDID
jgi:hypothetical protein